MRSLYGVLDPDPTSRRESARVMFDTLAIRGGAERAEFAAGEAIVGIRSDADAGSAIVANPERTLIAAVEGEIYNLADLREILTLYERSGEDFARSLNGVFGIALYDVKRRRLVLVRDHLGSHSLFFSRHGDRFVFATTVHPILASAAAPPEICSHGLNAYFAATAVPPPGTMLEGVFATPAGSAVVFQNAQWSSRQYWRSQDLAEEPARSEEESVEEVRALLLDAIRIRARAGGAFGSLVSGGLDTSIIAATLAGMQPGLPVFSIDFAEQQFSDRDLQRVMYRSYALRRHSKTLTAPEFAGTMANAVRFLDTPVNDCAFVGMFHAFQLAREAGCRIVFDGEGADELFFTGHGFGEVQFQRFAAIPYPLRRAVLRSLLPSAPVGTSFWKKSLRFLYKLGLSDAERALTRVPSFYNHRTHIVKPSGADPLTVGRELLAASLLCEPLNRYFYAVTKTYLPDDLLFKNERMAAANGVTNRTPFIDYRLTEFAFRLPVRYKLRPPSQNDDGTKQVYKKAVRGLVPDEILARKKTRGFSQPSRIWFRGELKHFVADTLFGPNALCRDYLDMQYVRRLWTGHAGGIHNYDYLINSVLIFELWLKAFLKAPVQAALTRGAGRA